MTPRLEVRDLTKTFNIRRRGHGGSGKILAVDGVSLAIAPGETLGLVGESGCGKSTLGRTIVGLYRADQGEILIDGTPRVSGDPELPRHVQMVFQDPYTSLPPKMRVGTIVAEPLLIHHIVAKQQVAERVEQLLASVGLKPEHALAFPSQLSGGQRQRVGIARALAVEPSVIVADEPVSALDVSVQAQILNLLKDLQEEHGISLLFVSHDLGVVRYMSHRVAVMYLGRIVETGTAADIVDDPLHPYTRTLLAAVPSVERGRRDEPLIDVDPPNPASPPSGCAFHPRCPHVEQQCRDERPPFVEWRTDRPVACHLVDQIASTSGRSATGDGGEATSHPKAGTKAGGTTTADTTAADTSANDTTGAQS
ncbi:MAG: ABC transporter ATP-binding protein [Nitriliruptoraceae bacterium]